MSARLVTLAAMVILTSCQSSDGPAAEKDHAISVQAGAGMEQLCASATKVAAIYLVEDNNPEKIKEWKNTKSGVCMMAERRINEDAQRDALLRSADNLIEENRRANARADALSSTIR